MNKHEKINYIEFPSIDIKTTKAFFTYAFNWKFTDYGPDYVDVSNAGIAVGFRKSDLSSKIENGSTLAVFFSDELEKTRDKILKCGGKILVKIFSFPGGRRFHFTDPNGNEYAVWSDK